MADELNLEAERASLAAFPHPNSPHTSVNIRVDMDRAAYKAGFLDACTAPAAPLVADLPPPDFPKGWDHGAQTVDCYRRNTVERIIGQQAERINALERDLAKLKGKA